MGRLSPRRVVAALALLGLLLAVATLATGPLAVAPSDLLAAAFGRGSTEAGLALGLRLPRLITAALTGGALAAAGAGLQLVFRNPLASPDMMGVSSGAGLGAALALLLGAGAVATQGAAFVGGLCAAGLTLACATAIRTGDARLSLILCGLVTGALTTAGLGLVVILAEPYAQLPAITYWLLGSFTRATLDEALLALIPAVAGAAVLLWLGFRLDALSLGDEQARSLGLPVARLRLVAVAAAALTTAAAVAVAGVVGWIGLLAPHAARRIVGVEARRILPVAIALGAVFGLVIDRLAALLGPVEPPVGLLAAGIGAPVFLLLFIATARREP